MRIAVEFLAAREVLIPWNYLDALRGLFYRVLARGRPKLARHIHDEGFSGDGKRYKLLTFSLLYPEQYDSTPEGMRVQGRLRWWVSSPLDFVIEGVALGLLGQREVRLRTSLLHVSQVEVLPTPSFSGTMTLATLSPIFVSTGQGVTTEKLQKRFLSPQDPDFARVLNDNLRRKSIALHGQPFEGELHFEWLDDPKSKLMRVSDLQIRGWMMRFRVTGPVELIRLGYDAGFGERNAQGFGMVSVLEHHPHFAARNTSDAGPKHSKRALPSRRRPRP